MSETIVIVGAGHASGQLIASLKQKKFAGQVVLLGDEAHLPYQRPPLSKKYLAGELDTERLLFKSAAFYEDDAIQVHLNTRVTGIDTDVQRVTTDTEATFDYDQLVIATGSRARTLGIPGEDLSGVFYLRSIDDVEQIRQRLPDTRTVAIVGAGYIGLEVAAICDMIGLEVTVVEVADRVMSRVVSPDVSAFYQALHESHGVTFRLQTGVTAIAGDGAATGVITDAGDTIDADLVIIGAGIIPNTELAAEAGVNTDNGIVVDTRCRTSVRNVFAVGDCTLHPNPIYQRDIRLESVHNALEQAKTAAANLCGDDVEYGQVPWFWSDQYDVKLQIAGLSEGFDQVVIRGDVAASRFSCLYLRDGALIAIDAINSPKDFLQAKPIIAAGTVIEPAKLADATIDLKTLV